MRITLPKIQHNYNGFATLARLHAQTENYVFNDVEIDMRETRWFDADMCAAFGAILYSIGQKLNTINLINIQDPVEKILSKNGFLSHYGRVKLPDHWRTTIPYQHLDIKDIRYFSGYIENEFIHRSEIPAMSLRLLKKFSESIYEIFINAVLHSYTQLGIFSCGQFFPMQKRLDFTVADLGVGIHQNVREYIGRDLQPEEAIDWATTGNNTTRRGDVPGGLGLKLLGEFIDLNNGCLQIVSDAGYWRRENKRIRTAQLNHPFPGTVVNIEINTADTHSYSLTSELDTEDIF